MAQSPDGVLTYLRRLTNPAALAAQPDGALLRLFAERRDEAAYAALLQRHGPMVLAACRRVLPFGEDAEDAFQATFLVLARRAGQIGRPERLGPWLYGVALRVARKLRRARPMQPLRGDVPEPLPAADRELHSALDEEIDRLPARYREPLVMCCLEGLSREEAAARLGTTPGAVKGLLERGRERLWQRLLRRGVVPALPAVPAAVPLKLASITVRATAGGAVAANVSGLAKGVVTEMSLSRSQSILALAFAALTCSGVGLAMQTSKPAEKPKEAKRPEAKKGEPEKKEPAPAAGEERIKPGDFLLIRTNGQFPDARINGLFEVEPSGKVPLGPTYGRLDVKGLTYEQAEAVLHRHLRPFSKLPYQVMITSGSSPAAQQAAGLGGLAAVPSESESLRRAITELSAEIRALRKAVEQLSKRIK